MKKMAIIGCGGMIYDFIYEYTKGLDVRLEAVCGEEEETERFAGMYAVKRNFAHYEEMLDRIRPDLVIVFPADESKQFEITKACLLSGADVLCERPICHSSTEGDELIDLQKQTGRFAMPRYNRRYMPAYTSARHIINSVEFGKTYMYHSSFHAGAYGSEAAFVSNHISHHLDLARMLLGEINLLDIRRLAEDDRRIAYNIVFESEKGTIGNIQSNSFLCGDYPMERVEISGNTRQLIVDNVRNLIYNQPAMRIENSDAVDFLANGGTKILNMNYAQLNNFAFYGFEHMLKEFVRCSQARVKPLQDIEDAMKTFQLIQSVTSQVPLPAEYATPSPHHRFPISM
jgi:predicted dehydrogenase